MFNKTKSAVLFVGGFSLAIALKPWNCNGASSCGNLPVDLQGLKEYTLQAFVKDFPRMYKPNTEEWAMRENNFQTNLQKVIRMRENPPRTWTPGITKFMDYHDHEFTRMLGYKGRRSRGRLSDAVMSMRSAPEIELPAFINVGANKTLTNLVHDQGACGSCWASAATAVLEGMVEEKNPALLRGATPQNFWMIGLSMAKPGLSMQAITSCTMNPRNCGGTGGCDGATAELAYDMVKEQGVPLESVYPYTSGMTGATLACSQNSVPGVPKVGISGYTILPSNKYSPLKQALVENGHPIAVAVDATGWNFYENGIYSDMDGFSKGEFTVNHEVTLMGYMDKQYAPMGYYLIKNSWGVSWGENGFIRLEMKDNEEQHCGWDNDAHIGLACDGDPDKVWVCGTCGILYDTVYPTGPYAKI